MLDTLLDRGWVHCFHMSSRTRKRAAQSYRIGQVKVHALQVPSDLTGVGPVFSGWRICPVGCLAGVGPVLKVDGKLISRGDLTGF